MKKIKIEKKDYDEILSLLKFKEELKKQELKKRVDKQEKK